ncbi:HAD-IIIC family phosphatase [Lentzea sp. NPDC102401]|uniref:HAD-IIIC family phosphatase n=1 Tax=Lentzea sp. NPDC102401 TaxID=3364128 RepID=UPI0038152319
METKEILARIRQLTRPDAAADPALLTDLQQLRDIPALLEAGRLLAKVPAGLLGELKPVKIAITGTFTASGVAPLLRVALLGKGIAPEIHVSGFDQLAVDLSSPDSPLASFAPQVTLCLLHDDWFVPAEWDDVESFDNNVRGRSSMFDNLVRAFTERSGSAVLVHTVPLSPVEMRGVVAFDCRAALGRAWRDLNSDLLGMALRHDQVHALDLEAYLVDAPARLRDERLYRFASAAWTPEVEQVYAAEAANFCRAFLGLAKKVLVLDLDNTLWGGVVGDDGPSGIQIGSMYPGNAFREMQRRAVQLRKQGVVLALASKNEAAIVDEVLNDHPDMVIRPADIAASAVDWQPKDHNIRGLASRLNLGLDSFVFADDSTFETQLVRGSIPEVTVVHLNGDPADHVTALQRNGSFDVLTTTATDRDRTQLYKARAERTEFAGSFSSVQDYLRSLEIQVSVREADEFSLPRLVQLGQRTNQFNMIGTSHAESRTREMAASEDHVVLVFEVADRFGAEGIVGGVWVSKHHDHWLVENFVMSCRVFTRGVEHTVVQHIADRAASSGAVRLEADFAATDRNKAAAAFYPDAGFERLAEGRFALPLQPRPQISPAWTNLVVERESADV